MAGRIGYRLFPAVATILLAVDAALGQGMQTFTSERAHEMLGVKPMRCRAVRIAARS